MPSISSILGSLDDQRQTELYIALVEYVYYDLVPAFMLESVAFGMVSLGVFLLVYCAIKRISFHSWIKSVLFIISVTLGYAAFATHWSLSLRAIYDLPGDLFLFANFFAEAIMFGALSTLVILLYSSFCSGTVTRPSFSKMILLVTIAIMYAMALAHFSAGIHGWLSEGLGGFTMLLSDSPNGRIILTTLLINSIFSDAVALWRACVVWMNQRIILCASAALLLVGVVSGISNLVIVGTSSPPVLIFGPFYKWPGLVFLGSSLLSNMFSTAVIGYKAWVHRQRLRGHLLGSRRTMAERILVIFVESGAIFIGVWIVYIALVVRFNTLEGVNLGTSLAPIYAIHNLMVQVVTIYPTCIILLVALERRRKLTHGSTMLPGSLPNAQPPPIVTISTMVHTEPSEVIVIRDEEFGAAEGSCEDLDHTTNTSDSERTKKRAESEKSVVKAF